MVTDGFCAFICSWVSVDLQHDIITLVVEKASFNFFFFFFDLDQAQGIRSSVLAA